MDSDNFLVMSHLLLVRSVVFDPEVNLSTALKFNLKCLDDWKFDTYLSHHHLPLVRSNGLVALSIAFTQSVSAA